MHKPQFFTGLDISAETIDAAVFQENQDPVSAKEPFANSIDGFAGLCKWLASIGVDSGNSVVCLETTGVYSENVCYYLHDNGFTVWSEAPHKVHRAFYKQLKNDKVAAMQIAEYAYRFFDKIVPFNPNEDIIEQVKTLLATREQLVTQKTANINISSSIKRKYYQSPLAKKVLEETIEHLSSSIKEIEKELDNLIKNNQKFAPVAAALDSIPGISMLFVANFLVLTDGLKKEISYKKMASYLGICPHEKRSGTSVYSKPRSSGFGHSRLRKLLYLAAMSVRQHCPQLHNYFVIKQAQGKNDKLILNNIANKLLRLICAISKNNLMYNPKYKSLHPKFLKVM